MRSRLSALFVTVGAASAALVGHVNLAFADACGRSAHASTGVLGNAGSSFVETLTPALVVGITAYAVRRWRKK
jgi:hypothetical protein